MSIPPAHAHAVHGDRDRTAGYQLTALRAAAGEPDRERYPEEGVEDLTVMYGGWWRPATAGGISRYYAEDGTDVTAAVRDMHCGVHNPGWRYRWERRIQTGMGHHQPFGWALHDQARPEGNRIVARGRTADPAEAVAACLGIPLA